MATYHFNEGTFDLPDIGFQDETVHFFRKKLSNEAEAGLMLVRTQLPEGRTFAESVARHVKEEAKRSTRHAILASREGRVAGLPAIDVATRWFHNKEAVYQRQVHLLASSGWMFFSMTSPLTEREACDEVMDYILASFRLRG